METVVQAIHKRLENGLVKVAHGVILVEPVMPHKDTSASLVANVRGTVAVHAGDRSKLLVRVVIVANVVGESSLLVRPVLCPLLASVVLLLGGTGLPVGEELLGALALAGDDEAGVPHGLALVVAVAGGVGVAGHGDEGVVGDVPEGHEPLEGHVGVHEDGVGVEEDDKLVRLEGFLDHGHLDPCAVSVRVVGGSNESIVVAVNHG